MNYSTDTTFGTPDTRDVTDTISIGIYRRTEILYDDIPCIIKEDRRCPDEHMHVHVNRLVEPQTVFESAG